MSANPHINSRHTCYHCGEEGFDHPLIKHGKEFCCNGCLTVYELLSENDLTEYYSFQERPGNKNEHPNAGLKYAFLDLKDIKEKIVLFSEGKLEKVKFRIPGIHCSSCIWLLENLHRLYPAVLYSKVNFLKKEATISYNKEELSLRELAEILHQIGYAANFNFEDLNRNQSAFQSSNLPLKLGIAGFCFGNIMLFSFPDYLSGGDLSDFSYGYIFGYLNILLSLPVVFYSASTYFSSAYKGIVRKVFNIDLPITLGIITLFSRSIYELISETGPGYLDSLAGLIFFLLIGKWFQEKTYSFIAFDKDYKSYFPIAVSRISNGKEEVVSINSIRENDVIKIHQGELIPCDSELIDDNAQVDYSFVTGESRPVTKSKLDRLFAGGKAAQSGFKVRVLKEISQSYLIELWNQEAFTKGSKGIESRLINSVSRYFTIAIISIASMAAIYWYNVDSTNLWQVVSAVLIVACPCALALSSPFTYGYVIRKFGESGFFMKNANALEELSHCDTVLFDKTGTLTKSEGIKLLYHGTELSEEELSVLYSLTVKSSHPYSITVEQSLINIEELDLSNFEEILGQGLHAQYNGRHYKFGSAGFTGQISDIHKNSTTFYSVDGELKGSFEMKSEFREGIKTVLDKLNRRFRIGVLSGDTEREKSDVKLQIPDNSALLFHQTPYDKLNYVKKLQLEGHKVIMVGDGLNDAGALKQSNFGIAVSESINHFSPSCDAILDAKKFKELPAFLTYSRTAINIIRICIGISLLYNIAGLILAVTANISPVVAAVLMPLSSISVVIFIVGAVYFTLPKNVLS